MKTLPLMMVEWEDGEGRLVRSVGFCVHEATEISDTIILAGSLEETNAAESVALAVHEIPMTNVIKKWTLSPPRQVPR